MYWEIDTTTVFRISPLRGCVGPKNGLEKIVACDAVGG